MEQPPDLVTVYRSMDEAAEDDCQIVVETLAGEGISGTILDDDAPGVPEGVWEVQVPAKDAARAEAIIESNSLPDEVEAGDDSEELDLETIYHSESSATGEMEALGIKGLLESNGISAVMVGDSVLPNFPFEVRVARDQAERALEMMKQAQANGPAAAAEAEAASERHSTE